MGCSTLLGCFLRVEQPFREPWGGLREALGSLGVLERSLKAMGGSPEAFQEASGSFKGLLGGSQGAPGLPLGRPNAILMLGVALRGVSGGS